MLLNIKNLYGVKIAGIDSIIGEVKDFYFDDESWVIRYLVADTGFWLSGRLILISPHAFGKFDHEGKLLYVGLTKKQIENAPATESHRPVSRQDEIEHYRYYGWPGYWDGGGLWGLGGYPGLQPPVTPTRDDPTVYHHRADRHLRSLRALTGYEIQAADGSIGHVSGLLVDDENWRIRELVVRTGPWYAGKEILISHRQIDRISAEESQVLVKLTMAEMQRTAEHALAKSSPGN